MCIRMIETKVNLENSQSSTKVIGNAEDSGPSVMKEDELRFI